MKVLQTSVTTWLENRAQLTFCRPHLCLLIILKGEYLKEALLAQSYWKEFLSSYWKQIIPRSKGIDRTIPMKNYKVFEQRQNDPRYFQELRPFAFNEAHIFHQTGSAVGVYPAHASVSLFS